VSEGGGLGIAVRMRVEDKTLPHDVLESFVKEAHESNCPYSVAIRGNVDVQFEIVGA
jgi:osmotically inducible protein OsmC